MLDHLVFLIKIATLLSLVILVSNDATNGVHSNLAPSLLTPTSVLATTLLTLAIQKALVMSLESSIQTYYSKIHTLTTALITLIALLKSTDFLTQPNQDSATKTTTI